MINTFKNIGHKGNTGWGCAQRRPLRALAHATLLFDTDFVLLVDDDSYINIKLLLHEGIFSGIIMSELRNSPLVLGQLTGGGNFINGGILPSFLCWLKMYIYIHIFINSF
jgi:hypothetical protein